MLGFLVTCRPAYAVFPDNFGTPVPQGLLSIATVIGIFALPGTTTLVPVTACPAMFGISDADID